MSGAGSPVRVDQVRAGDIVRPWPERGRTFRVHEIHRDPGSNFVTLLLAHIPPVDLPEAIRYAPIVRHVEDDVIVVERSEVPE